MNRSIRGFEADEATVEMVGKDQLKTERVARHLPYLASFNDEVIICKSGAVMASCLIDGIDSFTKDETDIDILSNNFAEYVGRLGEDYGFVTHKISLPETFELERQGSKDFAEEVDNLWRDSLKKRELKKRYILVSVTLKPNKVDSLFSSFKRAKRNYQEDLVKRAAKLDEAMEVLRSVFSDAGFERLNISSGKWLGLLATIQGSQYGNIIPNSGSIIAESLTNFAVTFKEDHILFNDGQTKRYGAIFGFKSYPASTYSTMLDGLQLPYDIVVTNSFQPKRANVVLEKMGRIYRQRGASEDQGISLTEQLIQAQDDVAAGRSVFGMHNISIQVFCDSKAELEKACSEIWRVGQEAGALLVRENWAGDTAYFGQAVDNWKHNLRGGIISAHSFAELSAFHKQQSGLEAKEVPWGKVLSAFPTISSTLYKFNFHLPGKADAEPSAGHAVVIGRTGSGKTLTTAFLATQARRANARLVVFDKDMGLEMAVRALGGAYGEVKAGKATGFNPFITGNDDRGVSWLIDWLIAILSKDRKALTTEQTKSLTSAVEAIVRTKTKKLKSFEGLVQQVASTDDGGELMDRVQEFNQNGRYGWLFSQGENEAIDLNQMVLGIDMTELLDMELERSALLSYLFRRIERLIEDRHPTIIVIDEAWKMLGDEIFQKRLHDWLVTMRKKNCVVVMLTQTAQHLAKSAVGDIIAQSAPTQILFPNQRAKASDYKILNLGEAELAFVTAATGGERLALIRSGQDSVIANVDLGGLLNLLPVLGGGQSGAEKAPLDWKTDPEFWRKM